MKKKILIILGPTTTGKSALSVKLAQEFNGEIISADSRQIYKGLNIGTGKIKRSEMLGVKHHLLDVANPKKNYSVSDFQADAQIALKEIISRGKLPIIVGGTGFYIDALVFGFSLPDVPPNIKLRKELSKKSTQTLYKMLKKFDQRRAKNIDNNNKVRLIRAIEIYKSLGTVPALKKQEKYNALFIGTKLNDVVLKNKINKRLAQRIKTGMIAEAKKLHEARLTWKRMEQLGLEYRYLAKYLQNKLKRKEMLNKLEKEIWKYSRRQITWFKGNKKINWFDMSDKKAILKIRKIVKKFVENKSKI